MKRNTARKAWRWLAPLLLALALPAGAADYPAPQSGSWVIKNFRFSTGEVLPEFKLHYLTVGEPTGEPVLILHGTRGHGTTGQAKWWQAQLRAWLAQDAR